MRDATGLTDELIVEQYSRRPTMDVIRFAGHGTYELIGSDGEVKQRGTFRNLITDYGDQYYAEAGAQVSPPADVTGMRLGTGGATPASKAGAGGAIVTYTSGSNKALDSVPGVSDLGSGLGHRVQYITTWIAGEATANGIDEAVITNETPLTDIAGALGDTLSRAVLVPVVNKGASDQLVITWNHDALGA
jgi:hypothetical protein